jgi:methyltransferase (TIGR00027 family)
MPAQGKPSYSALMVGAFRALHQTEDGGRILNDPFAMRVLGPEAGPFVEAGRQHPTREGVSSHFAARSRFAEDAAATALARGVRQIVMLGAGYDTFAYRCAPHDGLKFFEIDQPTTQDLKRERLVHAKIPIPSFLSFVPVDFEHQTLGERLAEFGFDASQPAFFIWLGVTYYLTAAAMFDTLGFVSRMSAGSEIVFDYQYPIDERQKPMTRQVMQAFADRTASLGEPMLTFFEKETLHARLNAMGLTIVEDIPPSEISLRFIGRPIPDEWDPERAIHFVHAAIR